MLKITVPTLACDACVNTLTKAIQSLDSTAEIQADLDSKILSIQTQVSESEIKSAITQAGHSYS